MYTLGLLPDQSGFNVQAGDTNIAVKLDGGAPRVRADQQGAVSTVNCKWTLTAAQFDYMMAFYRTGTNNGASPFQISLCGIDASEYATYTAQFVPGTFKPVSQQEGLTYVVEAQLWVAPLNNTANDATLLAAGAPA